MSVCYTVDLVYIFAYPAPLQFWPVYLLPKDGKTIENKTQLAQKNEINIFWSTTSFVVKDQ